MKILFICKHNRFRSKVAETIFNKFNKNKNNKSESYGLGFQSPYVAKNVIGIMKEKGYEIKGRPKRLKKDKITKYDLLIIVADNLAKKEFSNFKGKVIKWDISDCGASETGKIKKVIDEIEIKVKKLIESNLLR